jgi:environmental stress-induced protein Ves
MALHFYLLEECPATPWKNGGGSTREIACWPPAAGIRDFDWRISVADIDMDGPFSAFAEIDRTIMLLNGAGIQLTANDGSIDQTLSTPLVPFHFSGDTALECMLLDGHTQDFNVMARRNRWQADTMIVRTATQPATTPAGVIFIAAGQWHIDLTSPEQDTRNTTTLHAGAGFWWHTRHADVSLTPASADAAAVMVQLQEQH